MTALIARPATLGDADALLAWRNDPETRRWSAQRDEVGWAEHRAWLVATLAGSVTKLMVATELCRLGDVDRVVNVGTYRLDGVGSILVEVSLTVAPEYRGMGYSVPIVRLASQHAVDLGARDVIARVRSGNERSQRAFLRAGFRLDSREAQQGGDLIVYARCKGVVL